eukprot:CAMPEP_0194162060 /NCGR_PEP_ID=MMETSP0152-20130528/79292_1 /TAXON_ID=1049557 /ORGANISM="Thalassiothrix antarctica, Strain L6-D1" /LENGTH=656 /DNA_ID=CAMNT_0038871929 /DNA_START=154 /DNA_END=2125 /DNA_ORIENTATION=-
MLLRQKGGQKLSNEEIEEKLKDYRMRQKQSDYSINKSIEKIINIPKLDEPMLITRAWDVCNSKDNNTINDYPYLHTILHERRKDLREHYEQTVGNMIYHYNGGVNGIVKDWLPLRTLSNNNPKFALLSLDEQDSAQGGQGSAWNDDGEVIIAGATNQFSPESGKSPGGILVPPLLEKWEKSRKIIKLSGDYVAYTGWYYGYTGRFVHDNLPNIAYLKYLVSEKTKFLLGYDEVHAEIIKFIDPKFYEDRIVWIYRDQPSIYEITQGGTLSVTTINPPYYLGCCDHLDPLRNWVASMPKKKKEKKDKKIVLFYTRLNRAQHDNLPNIAYLKYLVSEKTKFLLGYDEVHAEIIKFIDPKFYKDRIVWIHRDQPSIYEITQGGTLSVTTINPPYYLGCCDHLDPLRNWVASMPKKKKKKKKKDNKIVLFYTRLNRAQRKNPDLAPTPSGIVLDPKTEERILQLIRKKMEQYRREETDLVVFDELKTNKREETDVVLFDELNDKGEPMSLEERYELFRSASVIIGPHGSGIGRNLLWTNPTISSCDDRVQILEFIPGLESSIENPLGKMYSSYFTQYRKWPFEYHTVLYTKTSTAEITDVSFAAVDTALNTMWGYSSLRMESASKSSSWVPPYDGGNMANYLQQVQTAKSESGDTRLSIQ